MSITVSRLNIYPVKSCAGIAVNQARVDRRGFLFDRQWMIVDERGFFITQRTVPRLSLIKVSLDKQGRLTLKAPNQSPITIKDAAGNSLLNVTVWKDLCQAVDQGPDAAAWLQDFLGFECRLVRMADDFVRPIDRHFAVQESDQVSFADGNSFLLASDESLADLNARLKDELPMNRFRANIEIVGAKAFAEDGWKRIKIGDIEFAVVKPCARCSTTTVNQETGEVGIEPLRTLATFRRIEGGVAFGQYLVHCGFGNIAVGDVVHVLSESGRGGNS